jgi:hypothetical protein
MHVVLELHENHDSGNACGSGKGSTKSTLPGIILIQIVYFFHLFYRSLVLNLPVPSVAGVKGESFFFRLKEFFWRLFYVQIGILQYVSRFQIYAKLYVTCM